MSTSQSNSMPDALGRYRTPSGRVIPEHRCTACAHKDRDRATDAGFTCDPTGKVYTNRGAIKVEYTCADCGFVGLTNHPAMRASLEALVAKKRREREAQP